MIKNRPSSKGYTVIELLVVIIIISIVASLGGNTYQSQRARIRHNDSIIKVLSLIKEARNFAVTSRSVYDESQPMGQETYIPVEGYGVYMSRSDTPGESRFVLFANTAASDDVSKNQFDEGQATDDIIEEEYFLPLDSVFVDLLTELSGPTAFSSNTNADENEVVIIFRPPLADAYMAANDQPVTANLLTEPNDFYLEFRQVDVDATIPSKYIHMNRIAGFPEIENP